MISLLLLVSNRDDSYRDDKKYANSQLLCFSGSKNLKMFYHNFDANYTFSVLGLILTAAFYIF